MAVLMSKSKSLVTMAMVMMMVLVVVQGQDTCSADLGSLNVCTPFVVGSPGGPAPAPPSAECCGALQAVNPDCLCNTLRVASRLPSLCNLPAAPPCPV